MRVPLSIRAIFCLQFLFSFSLTQIGQISPEICKQQECVPRMYPPLEDCDETCDLNFPVHFWIITDANGQNGIHQTAMFAGDIDALIQDRIELLTNSFAFSQMDEVDHFIADWNTEDVFPDNADISFYPVGVDVISSNDIYYSATTNGVGSLSQQLLALCMDAGYNCDAVNVYLSGPNAEVSGGVATNLDGLATRAAIYLGGSDSDGAVSSSSTLIHEMGHVFGLYHVFHNTGYFIDEEFNVREIDPEVAPAPQPITEGAPYGESGDLRGDFVEDTYPVPLLTVNDVSVCDWAVNLVSVPNYDVNPTTGFGAPFDADVVNQTFPASDEFDQNTTIDGDEITVPLAAKQLSNFMGYYPASCKSTFTPLQAERMICHARTSNLLIRLSCGIPLAQVTESSCGSSDGVVAFQFLLEADLEAITVNGDPLGPDGFVEFSPLAPGDHSFIIEGYGCNELVSVFVPQDSETLVNLPVTISDAVCPGGDGVISADVLGTDPSISWFDVNGDVVGMGADLAAAPGIYTLFVSEGSECFQGQYEIGLENDFNIVETQSTVNCSTDPVIGSHCFYIEHIAGDQGYTWNFQAIDQGLINAFFEQCNTGLSQGNYSILVSNDDCTQQFDFSISEDDIFDISAAITNAQCIGEGAICASMIGYETPSFTYTLESLNLFNVPTNESIICIENLEVGSYSLSVVDDSGCSEVVDFSIGNLVAADIDVDNPGCNAEFGSALIQFSCGVFPFSVSMVSLTEPDAFTPIEVLDIFSPSYLISDLPEGIYQIVVSNANDAISYTIEILPNFGPEVEFFSGECSGGINAEIIGPSITVDGNNAPFIVEIELLGGEYNETVILEEPQVDNHYVYSIPLTQLPSGVNADGLIFYVHVIDDTGCEQTIIGQVPSSYDFNLSFTDYCQNGGDLCFDANVGQTTNIFIEGLGGNPIYQDGNGTTYCIDEDLLPNGFDLINSFLSITNPPNQCQGTFSLSPFHVLWSTEATCLTQTSQMFELIIVGPPGNYSYDINDGDYSDVIAIVEDFVVVEFPIDATSIDLVVENEEMCSVEIMSTVSGFGFTANQTPICFEDIGQIEIEEVNGSSGDYDVLLDGALVNSPISIFEEGTYLVTVQDAVNQNCAATQPFTFGPPVQLSLDVVSLINETCDGQNDGQIEISVTGGSEIYSYAWTGPNGTILIDDVSINNLQAGTYYVGVTDLDNGCYIPGQFEVTSSGACCPNTLATSSTVTPPTCPTIDDGEFSFSADGLYPPFDLDWESDDLAQFDGTYDINDFPLVIENIQAGDYQVTITDNLGCILQSNVDLIVPYTEAPSNPISDQASASLFDGLLCTSSSDLVADCATCGISNMELYMPENSTILIEDGSSFTLNDCILFMSEGSQIVVNEGGSLTLNDCELKSCGSNWLGIDVRADFQTAEVSGVLTISDGKIMHAENAIETGDLSYDLDIPNYNLLEGGTINCNGSLEFENNQCDFRAIGTTLYPDSETEQFSFDNCHFTITDDYENHFDGIPLRRVDMSHVRGYGFENCTFQNLDTESYNWDQRGRAIRGYNLKTDIKLCTFSGFREAIRVSVTHNHFNYLDVEQSTFTQCQIGIFNAGICFQELVGNTIHVNDDLDFTLTVEAEFKEGICIDQGLLFAITDNTIQGHNFVSGSDYTYGIRIIETETSGFIYECYQNYLDDLNYGNYAQGNNAEGMLNGLRYLCNAHNENENDIYVSGIENIAIGAQQYTWFSENLEYDAGNSFGDFFAGQNPITGHLHNDGLFFNYKYTPVVIDQDAEEPNLFDPFFVGSSLAAVNYPCDEYENEIVDEDDELILVALSEHVDQADDDHNQWEAVKFLYLSLIDDGNTQALRDEIDGAWSEDTWAMRDLMLSKSPHLSSQILYDIADRTDVFPHPVALEIIVANPDAIRDVRFMDYLATKMDPMPDYMIDIIWASRNQETLRTEIENDLIIKRHEYVESAALIMHALDSDFLTYESLYLSLLDEIDQLQLEFGLIERELSFGNPQAAQARYNEIPSHIQLTRSMEIEYDLFQQWIDLRNQMIAQNLDWIDLTPVQLNDLTDFVDFYDTWCGRSAMTLLNYYFDEDFYVPPLKSSSNWTPRDLDDYEIEERSSLSVFPNPAKSIINVKFEYSNDSPVSAEFFILDAVGKQKFQTSFNGSNDILSIDVREWPSGLYVWHVENNGILIERGKIEVVH